MPTLTALIKPRLVCHIPLVSQGQQSQLHPLPACWLLGSEEQRSLRPAPAPLSSHQTLLTQRCFSPSPDTQHPRALCRDPLPPSQPDPAHHHRSSGNHQWMSSVGFRSTCSWKHETAESQSHMGTKIQGQSCQVPVADTAGTALEAGTADQPCPGKANQCTPAVLAGHKQRHHYLTATQVGQRQIGGDVPMNSALCAARVVKHSAGLPRGKIIPALPWQMFRARPRLSRTFL